MECNTAGRACFCGMVFIWWAFRGSLVAKNRMARKPTEPMIRCRQPVVEGVLDRLSHDQATPLMTGLRRSPHRSGELLESFADESRVGAQRTNDHGQR